MSGDSFGLYVPQFSQGWIGDTVFAVGYHAYVVDGLPVPDDVKFHVVASFSEEKGILPDFFRQNVRLDSRGTIPISHIFDFTKTTLNLEKYKAQANEQQKYAIQPFHGLRR